MGMVSGVPHSVNDDAVGMTGMGIPQIANYDDMKGDEKRGAGSTRTRPPWSVGGEVLRFGFAVLRT